MNGMICMGQGYYFILNTLVHLNKKENIYLIIFNLFNQNSEH